MNESILKTCAYCNAQVDIIYCGRYAKSYEIVCSACGCFLKSRALSADFGGSFASWEVRRESVKAELINRWNHRPEEQRLQFMVDRALEFFIGIGCPPSSPECGGSDHCKDCWSDYLQGAK